MNQIAYFLISLALTLFVTILIATLLKSSLKKVLLDLCGTEERAHFWTMFSMIILIAMPMLLGMGYKPESKQGMDLFFEMAGVLRGNLFGFLFALVVIGGVVSFFALFAPKPGTNKDASNI